MDSRNDFDSLPPMGFEEWTASARSKCIYRWTPELSEPRRSFAASCCRLNVHGFTLVKAKMLWGSAAGDLDGDGHRLERTQWDVRRGDWDGYNAVLQISGRSTVMQKDQAIELSAGKVALLDGSRPVTLADHGSVKRLLLALPREQLVSHLGSEPQGCLNNPNETHAARLLFRLLDEHEAEDSPSGATRGFMRLAVYDVLGALFAPSDEMQVTAHTDKLFGRICAIIQERFTDPDFGPVVLAAEAGISQRYLEKLFTARGMVCNRFIQSVRLDYAGRLLQRRAKLFPERPLSEIAYACGFRDYGVFLRNFRRKFGHPPSSLPIQ